jgi:hypothetical protein
MCLVRSIVLRCHWLIAVERLPVWCCAVDPGEHQKLPRTCLCCVLAVCTGAMTVDVSVLMACVSIGNVGMASQCAIGMAAESVCRRFVPCACVILTTCFLCKDSLSCVVYSKDTMGVVCKHKPSRR